MGRYALQATQKPNHIEVQLVIFTSKSIFQSCMQHHIDVQAASERRLNNRQAPKP